MKSRTLTEVHEDVPPDFYDTSIRTNYVQRLWHGRRFQKICELFSTVDGAMLDVGCDGATLTEKVGAKAGAQPVVGIDLSDKAVAYARKQRPQIDLAVADGEQLPFRESVFEAILCSEVFEHLEHPEVLLSEIRRCLKKDGYSLIVVPAETPLFKVLWFLWTRFGKGKVWRHAHVQDFGGDLLDRLVEDAGFRIVEDSAFVLGMLRAIKISPA